MSSTARGSGILSGTVEPGSMRQGADNLEVNVTIHRVTNLPVLKNGWGKNRRFYVSVTDGANTKRSRAIRCQEQSAVWNERLDGFVAHGPSDTITVSLYAKRQTGKDIPIGTLQIKAVPSIETSWLFEGDVSPGLTIVLSVDISQLVEATKTAIAEAQSAVSSMNMAFADDWQGTIESIKRVMDTVGTIAQIHPYFQIVWDTLASVPKLVSTQIDYDKNVQELVKSMRHAFDLSDADEILKAIKPNSNRARILTMILRHIKVCSEVIVRYSNDKDFVGRLRRNITGGTAREIQDLCKALKTLRQELLDDTVISTQVAVERMERSVDILPKQISDMDIDMKMNELPYKSGWGSASKLDKNGCLPGTRTAFLEYISKWVDDPSSKVGLALFGQAGTGKSTIAHEIALLFRLQDRLASYASFSRNDESKNEGYHLFTTMIHDLADRFPAFKTAVGELIKDNKYLRATDDFDTLFDKLLLGPLMKVKLDVPIVIVIDALDECANPFGKRGLAAFLASSLGRLPPMFRILITTRPDGDIANFFSIPDRASIKTLDMKDPTLANADHDIRLYFKDSINFSPEFFQEYGDALVQKSEGLFQWAAVACGHINNPPPGWTRDDCIRGLLRNTEEDTKYAQHLNRPLYELYDTVLSGYFNTDIAHARFRSVMGHLLTAVGPLSIKSLTHLRQFTPTPDRRNEGAVFAIVRHLGSLLSNVNADDCDMPIVPLHTSFRDYLTEVFKEGDTFFVDIAESDNELGYACLRIMLKELKFNICEIESSYIPNSDIPDLENRINQHIHPALCYACWYWDRHLDNLPISDGIIFDLLRTFFEKKFLSWLEVLSVTNKVTSAGQAISKLKKLMCLSLDVGAPETILVAFNDLVTDAHRFLLYFATLIAECAAHIYISAFPFSPTSSKISHVYSRAFSQIVNVTYGRQIYWPALEMSVDCAGWIHSVAFSPDTQSIATTSDNSDIHLWDAITGKATSVLSGGHHHDSYVSSVAFSPDGHWIASGSNDMTVCLWNLSTAKPITLKAHTDGVNSVAFSNDGKWIVSGSADTTIILWDASSGRIEKGPYMGHTEGVQSVAFSPSGRMIVSGSSDREIRVWNTFTGKLECDPLKGHTGIVMSVAFSPDGRKIASGSYDRTILLWDICTGSIEQGPLTGHNYGVTSVAFLPDGNHIISGSYDNTVRIWNVNTEQAERILDGHTHWVYSVAMSSDGQRIVSGSQDKTFRLWNATTTELLYVDKPHGDLQDDISTGHTDVIRSVTFSPDGEWITTGSDDHTFGVWSAATGYPQFGPFRGGNGVVFSAVFSPNGKEIATGSDDNILLWDISDISTTMSNVIPHSKQNDAPVPRLSLSGHTSTVKSVAFSPDGQLIASGSNDHTIRVWDVQSGESVGSPFIGHTGTVASVAFSPDGKWVASGSWDTTIRLWNASIRELKGESYQGHRGAVNSVAFSPNGVYVVSGSDDCTLRLWNTLSGVMERGPLTGHTDEVTSVAFSPDGSQIASASCDLTIRVWSALSGEQEYVLIPGHTEDIYSISFSPDGTLIASGGQDCTVRVMPLRQIAVDASEISFNDLSVVDRDGWIRGNDGELLLWIPSLHRAGLYRPTIPTLIIGKNQTRLDTSKFVHGKNWTACYTGCR